MSSLPDKAHYRIDELALHWDVTERAIRLWIEHGRLQAVRIGGAIRIPRASVLAFPLRNGGQEADRT